MWISRFCSGSVPVRSSSGVSTIKWWKNRRDQIGGGRKGAIPKQKAKAGVPQDRQPDRHGPGSVSSSARRTSPTTQPYAAVDLGHEAAGACEAPPHHRRDAGRPGGASTRPYWNGVRRSGGQLPAPPGPRNRRCRAARTPCRLRPRGAAHPADPALADPRASASASKTSTSNQRRVEVARPPVNRGHEALTRTGFGVVTSVQGLPGQHATYCAQVRARGGTWTAGERRKRGRARGPGTVHHARAGRTSPYPRKQL